MDKNNTDNAFHLSTTDYSDEEYLDVKEHTSGEPENDIALLSLNTENVPDDSID